MKFVQHLPIAGVDPLTFQFRDTAELLAHPWIARLSRDPGFHRFSLSNVVSVPILMLERKGGREWRVLGYLKECRDPAALGLPEWKVPGLRTRRTAS